MIGCGGPQYDTTYPPKKIVVREGEAAGVDEGGYCLCTGGRRVAGRRGRQSVVWCGRDAFCYGAGVTTRATRHACLCVYLILRVSYGIHKPKSLFVAFFCRSSSRHGWHRGLVGFPYVRILRWQTLHDTLYSEYYHHSLGARNPRNASATVIFARARQLNAALAGATSCICLCTC